MSDELITVVALAAGVATYLAAYGVTTLIERLSSARVDPGVVSIPFALVVVFATVFTLDRRRR
jgi:hypothetical protein